MQTSPPSVESIFSRSWQLLSSNWIIVVPGLVIGILAGIITGLTNHPAVVTYDVNGAPTGVANMGAAAAGGLVAMVVSIIAVILSISYTTGMAGAAWARGTATLADGGEAFKRDAGNVLVAMIGMFVIGVVAVFLALPTLMLSILAFYVFFLYTMPSAIVGERSGIAALQESCHIALKRFGPTIITVILIAVIVFVAGLLAGALGFIPFLGPIVGAVIIQICVAYFTLVIVGNYLAFRDGAPPSAPSVPPPTV